MFVADFQPITSYYFSFNFVFTFLKQLDYFALGSALLRFFVGSFRRCWYTSWLSPSMAFSHINNNNSLSIVHNFIIQISDETPLIDHVLAGLLFFDLLFYIIFSLPFSYISWPIKGYSNIDSRLYFIFSLAWSCHRITAMIRYPINR